MATQIDLSKLVMSWTKYSSVQLIDIVSNIDDIKRYLNGEKKTDLPSLKKMLGIENVDDPIPDIWYEIQKFPKQKRLFALVAAIFTHHENIEKFAKSSNDTIGGIFIMEKGKQFTNLRSALVESGAAQTSFRRKEEIPYNLKPLFENGEVGKLFKKLLIQRLESISWDGADFYELCNKYNFNKALSLNEEQFHDWLEGTPLTKSNLSHNLEKLRQYSQIKTYKINQWLGNWDDIDFSAEEMRKKPYPFFIMFKIDARLLKRISDVHRRRSENTYTTDPSIQRPHNESRSKEISNYVHGGFPWSTISESQRASEEFRNLKMPGMLPTAIIANILAPGTERGKFTLSEANSLKISELETDFPTISIPPVVFEENWAPDLKPLEIIDGQHRLWAFDEEEDFAGNYELPVIAYYDLDRAWQAYLFYTINIKPVKINTSLGYDLYPLLRTQKWLEPLNDGLAFYRENRAQELVEALWLYSESPWKNRIKMLGEGNGNISQAAFINALTSSYLKKSASRSSKGLFSSLIIDNGLKVLNWNRTQQAAFLILIWDLILQSLNETLPDPEPTGNEPIWAKLIRENERAEDLIENYHPGFTSKLSFLSRDQGVRGISMFSNDFFVLLANDSDWNLNQIGWDEELDEKTILAASIDRAIVDFKQHKIYDVIKSLSYEILKMDWRTSSAIFTDNPDQRTKQQNYKGSSGYTEIWKELIRIMSLSENSVIKQYTPKIAEIQ